jgi:GNAT superfamily N-acetyltransferase
VSDPWRIEQLEKFHDRNSFDCGAPALNDYLQKTARQAQTKHLSRTYVAVSALVQPGADNTAVHGFFTIAAGRVNLGEISDAEIKRLHLSRHPVPVVLLGRLAVDKGSVGQGLGRRLLIEALERASLAAQVIGAAAVEVHAKDSVARDFYKKYGFVQLLDDEDHLWLSMKIIEAMLRG